MAHQHARTSVKESNGPFSFRRPSDYRNDYRLSPAHRRSYSDRTNSLAIQPYTGSGFQHRDTSSSAWNMSNDPEVKRNRRLAGYKVYGLEGRAKSTLRKSFRWLKDKYFDMRYGWS